ncbi:VIT-domain-containing protein [Thozetella sp. PMI_491]|nr:VIT-domain-containing protein [Thozetella sp. PMI_491]
MSAIATNKHVCGLYYLRPPPPDRNYGPLSRCYLPQLSLSTHTRIISFSACTIVTQKFVNPSNETIPELRYTFPLYDGVSVTGFIFTINQARVIRGVVKEREEAKQIYNAAVAQGQTAGLLEQLPDAGDIFTTTIGNIPGRADIVVQITYLGELMHDAEINGIRFTIPTQIAPRYGNYPGELLSASTFTGKGGIEVVVDIEMPTGSSIRTIQSPSHPISVTLGSTSSSDSSEASQFSPHKALASLSLGTTELDGDFVLQVVVPDTEHPVAILETHPTIPNQRALMATLVPRFNLPACRPELVFICDRSGSMQDGHKISNVKTALNVFLKSLPLGVKFNICSFGSNHSFLFDRSQSYGADSLRQAIQLVNTFAADFGGTEIYAPLEDAFKRRFLDMDLEVFLLTDGQVWGQEKLVEMINRYVAESDGKIRVFTLGIGPDVSHSLIEGIAAAGNGFSQTVADKEKMNNKVTRMLQAALSPHVTNYTLQINYENESTASDDDDHDFEIVEKVMDALSLEVAEPNKDAHAEEDAAEMPMKPISLFSTNEVADVNSAADNTVDKYAHLPAVTEPKLLQAPFVIPPLFRFNRTNIYLLLSPDTTQRTPKSILLRGISKHGPLELEIAVATLAEKSATIHQLAARKAVKELESGRGWIVHARDNTDSKLLRDKYDGRFSDMVAREAVRLGVRFQVGSRWCSFVAVENDHAAIDDEQATSSARPRLKAAPNLPHSPPASSILAQQAQQQQQMRQAALQNHGNQLPTAGVQNHALQDYQMQLMLLEQQNKKRNMMARQTPDLSPQAGFNGTNAMPMTQTSGQIAKRARYEPNSSQPAIVNPPGEWNSMDFASPLTSSDVLHDFDFDAFLHSSTPNESNAMFNFAAPTTEMPSPDVFDRLVSLQSFNGAWIWSAALLDVLGLDAGRIMVVSQEENLTSIIGTDILATALVLAFLHLKLATRRDEWEMLADKAKDWIKSESQASSRTAEGYIDSAKAFL